MPDSRPPAGCVPDGTHAYVARFSAITCDQPNGGSDGSQPTQLPIDGGHECRMVERVVRAMCADDDRKQRADVRA